MASRTEICNMALVHIGQEPILTLDEETKQSRLCKRLYETVRDATLRSYPWTFAIKRVILAPDLETPAFEFEHQFTLPSDCIRVVSLSVSDEEYVIEGNKILTNRTEIRLRYITNNTIEALFDPQFCQVLAIRLAKALCQSLTADQDLIKILNELERPLILQAMNTNAVETSQQPIIDDGWLMVRY